MGVKSPKRPPGILGPDEDRKFGPLFLEDPDWISQGFTRGSRAPDWKRGGPEHGGRLGSEGGSKWKHFVLFPRGFWPNFANF